MPIHARSLLFALIAGLFLSSCSSRFSLDKRRYNKGYHFTHARAQAVKKQQDPREQMRTAEARLPLPVSAEAAVSGPERQLIPGAASAQNQAAPVATKARVKELPALPGKHQAAVHFPERHPAVAGSFSPPSAAVPYNNWGGNVLFQVLAYVAGTIISILLVILVFIIFDAIVSGTLAGLFLWLGPVLLFLLVIGAVAAGLVILYNSD